MKLFHLSVVILLALIPACRRGGVDDPVRTSGSLPTPLSSQTPLLAYADSPGSRKYAAELRSYLGPRHAKKIRIQRVIRTDSAAFLSAIIRSTGKMQRSLVSFVRIGRRWVVREFVDQALPPQGARPKPESNGSILVSLSAGGDYVMAGYVDPTLTRVEVLDGKGRLLAQDSPTQSGLFIVPIRDWATLRFFRNRELTASAPVFSGEFPGATRSLDDQAVKAAREFVLTARSLHWETADELLIPKVPGNEVLPPLHQVLRGLTVHSESIRRSDVATLEVKLESKTGGARLSLPLVFLDGSWRIVSYSFRADA